MEGGQRRQLGSRRGPVLEGARLAQTLDIAASAAFVVIGFGLGHHAAAIAERIKHLGTLVVYESDLGLLRAVLEAQDFSAALARTNFILLTEADDTAAMAAAVSGLEGILASGTRIVEHPPSRQRLADTADRFTATFAGVMRAVRTQIVTTLVQVEATLRNCLQNLGPYATCPGIDDLLGCCASRNGAPAKPAVVVSAGPSLERNIELLSRPGVRDRVVIIAVQTALKPLLARGIKPHFVTALDYHEISRRFYEGLTEADVEGVTLVAEPKANPAILASFPGVVRCVGDHVLDRVLGEGPGGIARPMARLTPGATVAHLAYYFARALGCDPVILIGQDLGFTDGQYYAAGAAIHQVWAPELHEFRTLEMFEWERIMRMKSTLRRVTDQSGRPMFTDEQMATYLVQFERDFTQDQAAGLTTIDATEGGAMKRGAVLSTLAAALRAHAAAPLQLPPPPATDTSPRRREAVLHRLRELNRRVMRISALGRETAGYLREMIDRYHDQPRVNTLIAKAQANAQEAASLTDAHWLVQFVNQTGQLNRYKADRAIEIDPTLSDIERQKRQIERDLKNVTWLADAADRVGTMLCDAMRAIETGEPLTRDPSPPEPAHPDAAHVRADRAEPRIAAAILVDTVYGGLNQVRPLQAPFGAAPSHLAATLARLAQVEGLTAGVVLITNCEASTRQMLDQAVSWKPALAPMRDAAKMFPVCGATLRQRMSSVARARAWARWCWRSAPGGLSVFDEVFHPVFAARACEMFDLDAIAVLGADWCCLDPRLATDIVARFREKIGAQSLTFSQAPPGLAPAVLGRSMVDDLSAASGPLISIGGMLSYIPIAPQSDPIGKSACIAINPGIRDALERCIPDGPASRDRLAEAMRGATDAAALISRLAASHHARTPELFEVALRPEAAAEPHPDTLIDAITAPINAAECPAITIDAREPGSLSLAAEITNRLRSARTGAAVHIRTALQDEPPEAIDAALTAAPAVLSVDLYATTADTYRLVTGRDDFETTRARVDHLLANWSTDAGGGLPATWIVPRITRCDAVYEEIEGFYDTAVMRCGAAVIDPMPAHLAAGRFAADRIRPLPVPQRARERSTPVMIRPRNATAAAGASSAAGAHA